MFERLMNRRRRPVDACFCTLAIHPPYRRRAKLLVADAPAVPWIVLTDEPDDFAGTLVQAIRHEPTGPMAIDFQTWTAKGQGRPAYHDKRFVLQAALKQFDTAIFIDADSRIGSVPRLPFFQPGIALVKELRVSIVEHLSRWGPARKSAFEELALRLMNDANALATARWCSEALFAVTKDGNESRFFDAWDIGAELLQSRGLYSGEGGVMGLAAAYAGWKVDYKALSKLAAATRHEGQGPKVECHFTT